MQKTTRAVVFLLMLSEDGPTTRLTADATTAAKDDDMTADTIRQHFGANQTAAMIGATYAVNGASLTVKFKAGNAKVGNCVVIDLKADDTYSMTYYFLRGIDFREVAKVEGITAESLRSAFELKTKLATRL
jgi:hypothetical protein